MDSGFHRPKLPGFRIPDYLTWGDLESDLGITDNALAWFKWYLSDRFQRVSVNGSLSNQFSLKQGVLQGSCLGPLAFQYLHAQTVSDRSTPPPTSPLLRGRYTVVCIIQPLIDLRMQILSSSP